MDFNKTLFNRGPFMDDLNAKLRGRMIVYIGAQAGWGKTIAVTQWLQGRANARLISARALTKPTDGLKGTAILAIDDLQELSDAELQKCLLPLLKETTRTRFILIGRATLPATLCPLFLSGQLAVMDQSALCLNRDILDTYLAETEL
ncbi:MAG TPA: hypothetical protein PLP25_06465, partial [Candidatus Limiplasma sp.]|nr:hypothetical protein [Candidatus Limiplasma sp.]